MKIDKKYRPGICETASQQEDGEVGKVEHFEERFDLQFVGFRPDDIAAILSIPRKNDHPAGFVVSKGLAHDCIEKAHVDPRFRRVTSA